MGDGSVSSPHREQLERDIDGMQAVLKSRNEQNKPPPPPPPPSRSERRGRNGDKILGVVGAIAGGVLKGLLG